jgi:hypothetical protein
MSCKGVFQLAQKKVQWKAFEKMVMDPLSSKELLGHVNNCQHNKEILVPRRQFSQLIHMHGQMVVMSGISINFWYNYQVQYSLTFT